jgi:hypothetical protein
MVLPESKPARHLAERRARRNRTEERFPLARSMCVRRHSLSAMKWCSAALRLPVTNPTRGCSSFLPVPPRHARNCFRVSAASCCAVLRRRLPHEVYVLSSLCSAAARRSGWYNHIPWSHIARTA